jgi:hypothetical protein
MFISGTQFSGPISAFRALPHIASLFRVKNTKTSIFFEWEFLYDIKGSRSVKDYD